jgi:hypothetical protein
VGANPVDRGKPGSKLHLVGDGSGLPLTAAVTAANVADVTMLAAVVDDIPPVPTPRVVGAADPPRSTPTRAMTATPTAPIFGGVGATRGSPGVGSSPPPGWDATAGGWSGRCRGPGCFRRLQLRWDQDSGRWFAFVLLACAVVCCNRLHQAGG